MAFHLIIKTLSRKSNVDQLIRYVLVDEKIEPAIQPQKRRTVGTPVIKLSVKDKDYLEAESFDARLLSEFKAFKGAIGEFINELSSNKVNIQNDMESLVFKHNVRSRSINGYIKEFEANEALRSYRRKDSVQAYHTIISFSNLDTQYLNQDVLKAIMKQYVSLRGENSLYVGAVHHNRQHVHMHLVMSGVQYLTGKANRISRQEFQELKIAMHEYQLAKYPELKHSLPEHDKAKHAISKEITPEKNINAERTSDKSTLLGLLETTYNNSDSIEQFLSQISVLGHAPYYRNGRLQGIRYNNERKFRLKPLGFNAEKLEALNRKAIDMKNNLDEVANLRGQKQKREMIKENEETQMQTRKMDDLEELAALRGNTTKDLEQDKLGRDRTYDLESNAENENDNNSDDQAIDTSDTSEGTSDEPDNEKNTSDENDNEEAEEDTQDSEPID